jgi:outer membrane autotransporter protein
LVFEGGNNTFSGGLTADDMKLDGGVNTFNGSSNIDLTNGISASNAEVVLDNAALTFAAGSGGFAIDAGASMSVAASSSLDFSSSPASTLSVATGSVLDLGENLLDITGSSSTTVVVEFMDGSTIRVEADGGNQGQLGINGAVVSGSGDVYVDIVLKNGDIADLDTTKPIIDLGGGFVQGVLNLKSTLFEIASDFTIAGFRSKVDVLGDVYDLVGMAMNRNAVQLAELMTDIIDDAPTSPLASVLNDRVVELRNLASTDPAAAKELLNALMRQSAGETVIGVAEAVALTNFKAHGVILGRLDRIYQSEQAVPPAAGYGDPLNRVWVGGFGSWAKQKDQDEIYGYDYNSGGVSIGYDRMVDSMPGLRLGLAGSFSSGTLKVNRHLGEVDIDTFALGLYGSYMFSNDFFLDATVSYGVAENDSTVFLPGGGTKVGSFDIKTFLVGARVGKIFSFDNISFTPSVGLRYLSFSQDAWRETMTPGSFGFENWFAKKTDNILEIPVQFKVNGTFQAGQTKITPELRLGYTFIASKPDNELVLGFNGSNLSTTVYGSKPKSNSVQAGAGIKINVSDSVDIYANYDLDVAKKYRNHQASVGIGFNF